MTQALEFRRVSSDVATALGEFLEMLRERGDEPFFHPHELSRAHAETRSVQETRDLYYVAMIDRDVVAYGMLRGWDEGYEVPSLGIAVHPEWRGRGLAYGFMQFLHLAARARGATRIRLKVSRTNHRASRLYARCGYVFDLGEEDELVGFVTL